MCKLLKCSLLGDSAGMQLLWTILRVSVAFAVNIGCRKQDPVFNRIRELWELLRAEKMKIGLEESKVRGDAREGLEIRKNKSKT